MSHLEQEFADLWLSLYPDIDLHSEYQFSSTRRYRFDFCHLPSKVAIEIQGGIWMGKSGHKSGRGLTRDFEKLNLAASEGWRVFLLSGEMITAESLTAIAIAIQSQELTAIEELNKKAVNRRDYIGSISPKQIKGHTYWYWVYREKGKRYYKCLGTDRGQAIAKAKTIGDPRTIARSRSVSDS